MKSRTLWVFVVFAAAVMAAVYWARNRPPPPAPGGLTATSTAPAASPSATAAVTPASTPLAAATPAANAAKKARTEVPIQEGKTIDFSSGMAVVKDDAKQKAIIDKSVKEMESAASGVTFGPPAPAQKKAETPPR